MNIKVNTRYNYSGILFDLPCTLRIISHGYHIFHWDPQFTKHFVLNIFGNVKCMVSMETNNAILKTRGVPTKSIISQLLD